MTKTNQSLSGRTILLAPNNALTREITVELEGYGARVVACPPVEISELHDYALLDEAIENLFGYHWLIVPNLNSAEYFLRRFHFLGHEINELDALRICAIGDAVARRIEDSQVHVDLVPPARASEAVFRAIENYAGGRDALRGINFLVPRAANADGYLSELLEDAGARVDVVAAYRTVRLHASFTQLKALLAGGAIDCIALITREDVHQFVQLFDTRDLPRLFMGIAIACIDAGTLCAATELSLEVDIIPNEPSIHDLAQSITMYFSR